MRLSCFISGPSLPQIQKQLPPGDGVFGVLCRVVSKVFTVIVSYLGDIAIKCFFRLLCSLALFILALHSSSSFFCFCFLIYSTSVFCCGGVHA